MVIEYNKARFAQRETLCILIVIYDEILIENQLHVVGGFIKLGFF